MGKWTSFKLALIGAWDVFRSIYKGLQTVEHPELLTQFEAKTTLTLGHE